MEAKQKHGPAKIERVASVLKVSHLLVANYILDGVEGGTHEEGDAKGDRD